MNFENYLDSIEKRVIDWPDLDFSQEHKINSLKFKFPEHSSFKISKSDNIYALNKRLAEVTTFSNHFASANILIYSSEGLVLSETILPTPRADDKTLCEVLDDWVMNEHIPKTDYEIVVMTNPLFSSDSFVGNIISNGKNKYQAQIFEIGNNSRDYDFTIRDPHDLVYVSSEDFKNAPIPQDVLQRMARHYTRVPGVFQFMYGMGDKLDTQQKSSNFYTLKYTALDEE